VLTSALLAIAARRLPLPNWTGAAHAETPDKNWRHGLSLYSDLKYPPGFKHFEYVNASAPKGGTARQIAIGTFDNFNTAVAGVKGSLAAGIDLVYETLSVSALDEVSSEYCLVAEAVSFPTDFSSDYYRQRQHDRWHDGKPITPEDLHPKAGPFILDASQFFTRSDSFQALVQGNVMGSQVTSLRRTADSTTPVIP